LAQAISAQGDFAEFSWQGPLSLSFTTLDQQNG